MFLLSGSYIAFSFTFRCRRKRISNEQLDKQIYPCCSYPRGGGGGRGGGNFNLPKRNFPSALPYFTDKPTECAIATGIIASCGRGAFNFPASPIRSIILKRLRSSFEPGRPPGRIDPVDVLSSALPPFPF